MDSNTLHCDVYCDVYGSIQDKDCSTGNVFWEGLWLQSLTFFHTEWERWHYVNLFTASQFKLHGEPLGNARYWNFFRMSTPYCNKTAAGRDTGVQTIGWKRPIADKTRLLNIYCWLTILTLRSVFQIYCAQVSHPEPAGLSSSPMGEWFRIRMCIVVLVYCAGFIILTWDVYLSNLQVLEICDFGSTARSRRPRRAEPIQANSMGSPHKRPKPCG